MLDTFLACRFSARGSGADQGLFLLSYLRVPVPGGRLPDLSSIRKGYALQPFKSNPGTERLFHKRLLINTKISFTPRVPDMFRAQKRARHPSVSRPADGPWGPSISLPPLS